jgi:hypothetical protein
MAEVLQQLKYEYYKACLSESGTEVGVPLFSAVSLCDFSGRCVDSMCYTDIVTYVPLFNL